MSDRYMILPSKDVGNIRLLRVPDDFEKHEAFRHVTGVVAEVEEAEPGYRWADIAEALEAHGFQELPFMLGPEIDEPG